MYIPLPFFLIFLSVFQEIRSFRLRHDGSLLNQSYKNQSEQASVYDASNHVRRKRYLGLSRLFKLNKRYQECVAPGDAKGHCKHLVYCPISVLKQAKSVLDYLCVIERMHVGVCCPDDIALSQLAGSQIILDLPGGGDDYDQGDNTTGCGLSIAALRSNGQKSKEEWPWMAALYNRQKLEQGLEQQFCGGSLITEHHVLTAAHCTQGLSPEDLWVRLGEYNFAKKEETRSIDHEVESIKNHEDYDKATYAHDLALLKMKRPSSFNTYIWPICLPPRKTDWENKTAIVAGWGRQYFAGPSSDVLLNVEVPIWPLAQCANSYLQRIYEDNLCAAGFDGGKDACQGDSGGPLMYQLENGRWVVIGVVSWGIGCGDKGSPGIYTKVGSYIPWIVKNTITQ